MIVGTKTERFLTIQRHTDPAKGYVLVGNEVVTELHATKGWRRIKHRRQMITTSKRDDAARAAAAGNTTTFKLNPARQPRARGVAAIPITEKMLARHRERRRDIRRAAAREAWNNV